MKMRDLQCPLCGTSEGLQFLVGKKKEGCEIDWESSIEVVLVCTSKDCGRDCGYGEVILDTWESPLSWIENIACLLPPEGGPMVPVHTDERGQPVDFEHKGRRYEIAQTLLTCRNPRSDSLLEKCIYYLVRVEGGGALLRREETVSADSGPQVVWFLMTPNLDRAQFRRDSLPRNQPGRDLLAAQFAEKCYRVLYQLEQRLRSEIEQVSPQVDVFLKSVTVGRDDKQQTLWQKLSDIKKREKESILGSADHPILSYLEWTDLIQLMDQKWDAIFPGKPGTKKRFLLKLEDLRDIRNKVAHMRGASSDDLRLLDQASKDLDQIFQKQVER